MNLQPCPICGSEPEYSHVYGAHRVRCRLCETTGITLLAGYESTKSQASKNWKKLCAYVKEMQK